MLTLALLGRLSRKKCDYVLACMRFIFQRLLRSRLDPLIRLDSIPTDVRTLLRRFDLDPEVTSYLCCPKCYCLYREDVHIDKCVYMAFADSEPCGEPLFETRSIRGTDHTIAIRKYLHQDFKAWHARLLSRPDIESAIDRTTASARNTPRSADRVVHDILDSDHVQQLLGPDGKPFLDAPTSELRLIWGFGFDGFDPHHAKPGRAGISTNGLYAILMNLPPDMRLQQDNMFLAGAIAGKPSLDQINHFVKLVVDNMLQFWTPGVYFSRTSKFPTGRFSLGALLPLICDLLAARQISGFPSPTSTYLCSVCDMTQDDIENLEKTTWCYRTEESHRDKANIWRTLPNEDARKRFIKEGGVRWTEFLRLPYWKPNQFTVLESMHAHNLRNLRHHIWTTWGMSTMLLSGDGCLWFRRQVPACTSRSKPDVWRTKISLLRTATVDELKAETHSVLWHLCYSLNLRRSGSKKMLVRNLAKWVSDRQFLLLRIDR